MEYLQHVLCVQSRSKGLFLVTSVRKNPVCILWLEVKTESFLSPNPAAAVLSVLLSQPKRAAACSAEG